MQDNSDMWERAACRNPTPQDRMKYGWDLMYPETRGRGVTRQQLHVIQKYCNKCPLKRECREAGKNEVDGIWGGESRAESRLWDQWFAA